MDILYEWIVTLNKVKDIETMKEWDIVFTFANKQQVIELIKEQFKCVLGVNSSGRVSYRKSDKLVELYDRELIGSISDINGIDDRVTDRMVLWQLEVKSYAINLLEFFTHSFPPTAELVDFDAYPVLNLA